MIRSAVQGRRDGSKEVSSIYNLFYKTIVIFIIHIAIYDIYTNGVVTVMETDLIN